DFVSSLVSNPTSSCPHVHIPARIFPLHLLPFPFTITLRQALTHSSPSMRSTCTYQRNLTLLTTSTTHSIPKRESKSSLLFLSDNFTPHFVLTIALSVRSNLLAFFLILCLYGPSF